jgi:hypothetical protein
MPQKKIISGLLLLVVINLSAQVKITDLQSTVLIENQVVKFEFNLSKGLYNIICKADNTVRISNAVFGIADDADGVNSSMPEYRHKWEMRDVSDRIGTGKSLVITSSSDKYPEMIFEFTLYNNKNFLVINGGVNNNTSYDFRLKKIFCLSGSGYKGFVINENYNVLDGNSGGESTVVKQNQYLRSRNNLLATFGKKGSIHSLVIGGITYNEFEKNAEVKNQNDSLIIRLWSEDPFGRYVDKGSNYMPNEKCYVDVITSNPFEALEQYGLTLKEAQNIKLSYYTFPTLCLWYSGMEEYGGGLKNNDSPGAVWEMEQIAKSGFLKYSTASVRLVPDNYDYNNQQGWWDDEHWQKLQNTASYFGPCYKPPYETSKKWAEAVIKSGGIPLTYFQTARRSEDYCFKYPQHMLFNDPYRKVFTRTVSLWWDKQSPQLVSYDFTDTGFVHHMKNVYANLKEAGIKGLMYDYPDETGWSADGGFDNKYATTSSAYRNIFKLAYEGLGSDCYLDERTLGRGSDITLGLVASQRTFGDNDMLNPKMISQCGLRWYKNRVVVNYDTDAKNPNHMNPNNKDGVNAMLTMCYVATGRLLLGLSFSKMDKALVYSLSRIYPFHTTPESARPIDAFTGRKYPKVYDFKVNDHWHQLTLYNTAIKQGDFSGDWLKLRKESADILTYDTINIQLNEENFFGGLELSADKDYYFYDFWNEKFIGKINGSSRFEQVLRPGEARMISIHEAENNPQFISTDRHIMQGYTDMAKYPVWNPSKNELSGISKVIAGETYKIIIILNGYKVSKAIAKGANSFITVTDAKNGLAELSLERNENGDTEWTVCFKK